MAYTQYRHTSLKPYPTLPYPFPNRMCCLCTCEERFCNCICAVCTGSSRTGSHCQADQPTVAIRGQQYLVLAPCLKCQLVVPFTCGYAGCIPVSFEFPGVRFPTDLPRTILIRYGEAKDPK